MFSQMNGWDLIFLNLMELTIKYYYCLVIKTFLL